MKFVITVQDIGYIIGVLVTIIMLVILFMSYEIDKINERIKRRNNKKKKGEK